MMTGNKPAGYGVFTNPDGSRREIETRMCQHCQMKWEYKPGSGTRRGYCSRCDGMLCGKDLCMRYCIPYMDRIEAMEKGLKLEDVLESMDKKYGNKIIGVTTEIKQ